jgi:hypothetical protein
MNEIWKPILGFEGKYLISSYGNVFSLNKGGSMYLHSKRGYKVVELYLSKGKYKKFLVHRLVAIAFIPNPENKPFINHIDNDGLNNDISNLEWCTPRENVHHMIKCGRNRYRLPKQEKRVILNIQNGVYFNGYEEAAICFNISPKQLRRKLSGKTKNNTCLIRV